MNLREEKYEVHSECDHYKDIAAAYEVDIDELKTEVSQLTRRMDGCRRHIRNVPFVFLILLFLYTFCMFEMTYRYNNVVSQYGQYRDWVVGPLPLDSAPLGGSE